jgi:hypothetical protein
MTNFTVHEAQMDEFEPDEDDYVTEDHISC